MNNQQQKFLKYFSKLVFGSFLVVGAVETLLDRGEYFYLAEVIPENQNTELYSGFEESPEESLFFSNPMQILDAWRRSTAMEDATTPSDALDEAIKAFEGKEFVNSSND